MLFNLNINIHYIHFRNVLSYFRPNSLHDLADANANKIK